MGRVRLSNVRNVFFSVSDQAVILVATPEKAQSSDESIGKD